MPRRPGLPEDGGKGPGDRAARDQPHMKQSTQFALHERPIHVRTHTLDPMTLRSGIKGDISIPFPSFSSL